MNEIEKLKSEIDELKRKLKNKVDNQKKGMSEKASKGEIMSRPPFGYVIEDGKLVPAQNSLEIFLLFQASFAPEQVFRPQLHIQTEGAT